MKLTRTLQRSARLMCAVALTLAFSELAASQIIYVDASAPPGQNGTSPAMAYNDLNIALNAAGMSGSSTGNPAKILVAEGVYRPTFQQHPSPQGLTFRVPPGVEVVGGYINNGMTFQPTGIPDNTILEGKLLGGSGLRANNVVFVVPGPPTSVDVTFLQFLRIRNGVARANPSTKGAGIHAEAAFGMPIYLRVDSCLVEDNLAGDKGGGIYYNGALEPGWLGVWNTHFKGNRAVTQGGGVFMTFIGAILTSDGNFTSPSWVYNCTFTRNVGGMDPNSTATSGGGALFVGFRDSNPKITNCLFYDNAARGRGSVLFAQPDIAGSLGMYNCTASRNYVLVGPQGLNANGNPIHAPGGTVYMGGDTLVVANTILYGNTDVVTPTELLGGTNAMFDVSASNILLLPTSGSPVWPAGTFGPNINADPQLNSPPMNDFALPQGSPSVNSGSNASLPPDLPNFSVGPIDYDYLLLPRVEQMISDMGCYEFQP